ncbi:MAG: ABC transporter permease [Bacteroidia bacterium]
MYRLLATCIKECKLLIADKTGIAILFVMPVLLVVIMTLIQNEAYKSLTESSIPVLLVNNDNDSLGLSIENGFKEYPICELTLDHGEIYKTNADIKKQMLEGKFLIALIVPKNATTILRGDVENIMNGLIDKTKSITKNPNQVNIEIIIEPTANKAFVVAITSRLKEFLAAVKTKVLFQIMSEKIAGLVDSKEKMAMPTKDFFAYNENYAVRDNKTYQPNAIQHNIPAWAIFSIFFMVLPLAGSIITERSEGLFIRMRTFPGSYLSILSGKLFVYFVVALLQFAMVLLVGKYVLPLLGLPILNIGTHLFALVALTISLALAAVGYGLLVGTLFNTPQQSAVFGGISILIMSALGGIWVPLNIMPHFMQTISSLSPLNWALMGYYELFIKGGDWFAIQFQLLKLFAFFVCSLFISYRLYKIKIRLY